MAAVTRQLLFGRIWSRARVDVRHHDGGTRSGERCTAPGAVNQRKQKADGEQQNERQTAEPASELLS